MRVNSCVALVSRSGSFLNLRSTIAVETARQTLVVTTALPPCLAEEYRCGVFFCGLTGLSPIPWWVEKTGVGLCAVEKDGFSNKTEQPKLMNEMEWRFYQVGMVVSPRRQNFAGALKGQLVDDPRSWCRRRYSLEELRSEEAYLCVRY